MKLNHGVGQAAEDAALIFLQTQGCELIARNWHCRYGEIDLIMRSGNTLLFIEVKFRKNDKFGGAAYSITPAKLVKMQRAVETYLQQNPHTGACRLDAVLLQGNQAPQWIHNITG
ncbi:YraN family protein [Wielerella bovis]|uniref:YraN family protein n=1 Tax=Wielerella bovis TaxID=2917790 RepID=UPI002019664F|nr:YraN family protein [Wielerella bovis]MCG7657044.1 YraN family protein [Wielerella bovis]MCG7659267.1 YraN family protein [Wielerella bovis]ULJ61401.1 YraN family protein [Wielerella bovis]